VSNPVGCKTVVTSHVVSSGGALSRITSVEEWLLHPTKGWRRGAKAKRTQPVTHRQSFPRTTRQVIWKRF
jgi:hypothetical protein